MVDDCAAGYSASAAPLVARGLLPAGVSGDEFGLIGHAQARYPDWCPACKKVA